jgi:hypothetical protein
VAVPNAVPVIKSQKTSEVLETSEVCFIVQISIPLRTAQVIEYAFLPTYNEISGIN